MPQQAHLEGLKNNLPIHPEAALLDILHIQIHPLLKREVVAVRRDLPIAAQARRHIQTLLFVVAILLDLAGKCRAGPNYAHIALQDIPQLRQLIDAGLAGKLAHTGNARVFLDFEHRTPAPTAGTLLPESDSPPEAAPAVIAALPAPLPASGAAARTVP